MSVPLLTTKLFIPPPGKYLVERLRLVEKLNECLHPGCRLTLVSAPAGFGKTTLITTWVRVTAAPAKAASVEPGLSISWLSLDEGDNDPVILWTYLIAALQTQQPGIGKQALDLLIASPGTGLEGKLVVLLNDLVQHQHPWVLVLDDYHLIRSPQIQQSLSFFVDRIPPQFHVMIVSRTDPPLPLALLRGRGHLLELRLNDLRFSNEDAEAYLNAGIGLNLAAPSIQALNVKTEGWIAGLQMAALSLRDAAASQDRNRLEDFVASFSGSSRYILDYLIEEVLNQQSAPIQKFLVRTSILDRLCGPLCNALLDDEETGIHPNGQAVLEYLESANLFILPLDQVPNHLAASNAIGAGYWYRYHALFADLLRKRLAQTEPGLLTELHHRAVRWYEQNGFIPKAIDHAFQIRDYHKAAYLVSQITEELWGRGEHATLLAWLDALPEEEKGQYPHMLVFQVSMLISAGKLQAAEACIPILEKYIRASLSANPDQTALIGRVFALRTYIASFYGDNPTLFENARSALETLNREEDSGQRCGISLVLSNAYLTGGALPAASQALKDAVMDGKKAHKPHMVVTALANRMIVLWLQGNLKQAGQACQEGLALVQQNGLDHSPMAADLFIGWAELLGERHDLAQAEQYLRRGLDVAREQNYLWPLAWGYLAQSRLLYGQGNLISAEAAFQPLEQLASSHEIPTHLTSRAAEQRVKIWLRQGKIEQAAQYLQDRKIQADGVIQFPHHWEYLALARLLLARQELDTAAVLLGQICDWSETNQQTGSMISALALLALLAQLWGNHRQSVQSLSQALALAEPEGYIQTFVDEGDAMAALLREAVRQNIQPDYAGWLLAAFPDVQAGTLVGSEAIAVPNSPRTVQPDKRPLIEPLSRREMELLGLIAGGLSNKEIAQKLCLSLRTVKYYSTNLYTKLGVDGRMQAVIRARELGLL